MSASPVNPAVHAARVAALRARMLATGTDLVAAGPSSHMLYLTGLDPHGDERPVLFVVTQDWAGFLMPALNIDSARATCDLPMIPWTDAEGPHGALAKVLELAALGTDTPHVAIDETMRADFALLLLDALPKATRSFTVDTIGYLRARKDDAEFALLKASQELNDKAMQAAVAALKPGVTELDIAAVVTETYKAHGATPCFTLICFGPNGAFPHHHTGNTVLGANDAVLIDIGGRLGGYPSDMTRVAHMGAPSDEFLKVHAVLEAAVQAAVAAVRPGVVAREIDAAARGVITEAGYGEYFLHRTGHGLGLDVHETPFITATSESVLEEGMTFSIEPGIYLAGKFGLRLEEVVVIRDGKPVILSDLSRDYFPVAV